MQSPAMPYGKFQGVPLSELPLMYLLHELSHQPEPSDLCLRLKLEICYQVGVDTLELEKPNHPHHPADIRLMLSPFQPAAQ
jgi:uncharacterized protein (DUF3820 family)